MQRFTLLLIDAARPCRHVPGDRWFVDETYPKVAGRWVYLYRATDQFGQVIDVLVSPKRDLAASRRFFTRALQHGPSPTEVVTDKAAVYPPVLEENALCAWHHTERYANNRIESDHGRLKFRLRPMRGLKKLRCAQVISAGHAFIQNIRHGHYELGVEETVNLRVLAAFENWPWQSDQPESTTTPAPASHNATAPRGHRGGTVNFVVYIAGMVDGRVGPGMRRSGAFWDDTCVAMPPMTPATIEAVAVIVRRIDQRRAQR